MLERFINSYKNAFFMDFSDDLLGRFKRFESFVLDPKFHPSSDLKFKLKEIERFICQPLEIAIVGQFSSGKSTFLNALLGSEILPTGLTPVTAKITHIKYAPNYSLRVWYKNGAELNLHVNEIAKFVDQRVFEEDIESICIYAPCEILKRVSFVDTPGLNSLSNADTTVTKGILDKVATVIWLSLADNSGRASELTDIISLLSGGDKKVFCVLNQKDKLSQNEIENALRHCSNTFANLFDDVLAISTKQALKALQNEDLQLLKMSNFDLVLDKITGLDCENIKQNFVLKKCKEILDELIICQGYFQEIYNKAFKIILNFDDELDKTIAIFKEKFNPKLEISFNEIKEIAKLISDEILSLLKPKKVDKFLLKKGVFGREIFEKNEYEMMVLDSDEVFSKLIYNDVKFDKFFKTYRQNLKHLENELKSAFDEIYLALKYDFLLYKSEFENITKERLEQSDEQFASMRTYAGQVYEMFLKDYELVKFYQSQKISSFFERLNLKVASNYENAVKIAVYAVKEKIDLSRLAYEKDPVNFSIFIPSSGEIFNKVLTSFSLHEFENEMLSNVSFLNKILIELRQEFAKIKEIKVQKIDELMSKNIALMRELQSVKFLDLTL
ncbi:MAG: dynamin family protein [Campylobacter sp.]